MAAKAKAPVKAKKAAVTPVKSKAKAKPKGLILSAAQWKAYNKAYTATARAASSSLALSRAANRFRKYRLGSAYATMKQAQVATGKAQTSAIAAFAARQSLRQGRLASQNAALVARLGKDAERHTTLAGRAQFAQSGVKAYAHKAVMRTLDTAQARSYEKAIFAAAARAAKAGKKSVGPPKKRGRPTKASAAINAQASAAGLKAALAVKGGGKSAKAKSAKGAKQKNAKAIKKATAKGSAQSAKAPIKKAKSRTAPIKSKMHPSYLGGYWILGLNDLQGTCIMTAVANALWHQTGWRLPDEDIAYWTGRQGPRPTIAGILNMLYVAQPWPEVEVLWPIALVPGYGKDCTMPRIIGFRNQHGNHCAYAFENQMVSYGESGPAAMNLEEVWAVEFQAR